MTIQWIHFITGFFVILEFESKRHKLSSGKNIIKTLLIFYDLYRKIMLTIGIQRSIEHKSDEMWKNKPQAHKSYYNLIFHFFEMV
jgi:uncharacterized membrane protein